MEKRDLTDAVSRITKLPTLPTVLHKVMDTVADPEASALDLARDVAADQTLSARMLRLVNSAYYGFYRQITSLTDAAVILGFTEIRELVLTTSAFSAFPGSESGYDRDQLWRHSLAVAVAAERCAKRLKLPLEAGYFSAGLLHDIGKVTLDHLEPDLFSRVTQKARQDNLRLAQVETRVFGMDHAHIGAMLAEHWNLPETVVEAIRMHHTPGEAHLSSILTNITALANYMAYEAGLGESGNGRAPFPPEDAAQMLDFPENKWPLVVEELKAATPRIDAMLGAMEAEA